jgi:hypothetical protein
MALRYVLDTHLRGPLWRAIQWHNSAGINPLDVVRVGDPSDLPLGWRIIWQPVAIRPVFS